MLCSQCGKFNRSSANFCSNCGLKLSQVSLSSSELAVDQKETDIPEELYRAVIGSNNQEYYLKHFIEFDCEGKVGATWHWSAFFFYFHWLLYRKMWKDAFIYFLLPYMLMILLLIIDNMLEQHIPAITILGWIIYTVWIFVWCPMHANALYYKRCIKKIHDVTATFNDVQQQIDELSSKGGTFSIIIIIMLMILLPVLVIGILGAIAIPTYEDYITRLKLTNALVFGVDAEKAVDAYYAEYHTFPRSLSEAGFVKEMPANIQRVFVDQRSGEIRIVMADGILRDKSLILVPTMPSYSGSIWRCKSDDIKVRYLPNVCRPQDDS